MLACFLLEPNNLRKAKKKEYFENVPRSVRICFFLRKYKKNYNIFDSFAVLPPLPFSTISLSTHLEFS